MSYRTKKAEVRCLGSVGADQRDRNIDKIEIKLEGAAYEEGAGQKFAVLPESISQINSGQTKENNCRYQKGQHTHFVPRINYRWGRGVVKSTAPEGVKY